MDPVGDGFLSIVRSYVRAECGVAERHNDTCKKVAGGEAIESPGRGGVGVELGARDRIERRTRKEVEEGEDEGEGKEKRRRRRRLRRRR